MHSARSHRLWKGSAKTQAKGRTMRAIGEAKQRVMAVRLLRVSSIRVVRAAGNANESDAGDDVAAAEAAADKPEVRRVAAGAVVVADRNRSRAP